LCVFVLLSTEADGTYPHFNVVKYLLYYCEHGGVDLMGLKPNL